MTKTIFICDLCGKEETSSSKIANIDISRINDQACDHFDICSACRKNLMAFLDSQKKK